MWWREEEIYGVRGRILGRRRRRKIRGGGRSQKEGGERGKWEK